MSTRSPPALAALFMAVLAGCEGDDKEASTTDASASSGCSGSQESTSVAIPRDEYLMRAGGGAGETTTGGTEATAGDELPPIAFADCVMICQEYGYAEDPWSCEVTGSTETMVTITCLWTTSCIGRGHACVAPRADEGPAEAGAIAGWLAQVAHDEAASIAAFEALEAELAAHGAPAPLRARAREAAADEAIHAARFAALARAAGAEPRPPRVAPAAPRDLLAIAIENAVEGCVGETWGALEARYAASRAADPALRALLSRIADDELRHAELALALGAWLDARLDDAGRARVAAARRRAALGLRARLARRRDEALHREVGLPEPAIALRLHEGLARALWGAASA